MGSARRLSSTRCALEALLDATERRPALTPVQPSPDLEPHRSGSLQFTMQCIHGLRPHTPQDRSTLASQHPQVSPNLVVADFCLMSEPDWSPHQPHGCVNNNNAPRPTCIVRPNSKDSIESLRLDVISQLVFKAEKHRKANGPTRK